YVFVRNRPSEMGLSPITPNRDETQEGIDLFSGMKMVVTSGRFWPPAIWAFCVIGISFSIGGLWGGPYLMDVYGMTRAQAGTVLSMIAWGMIVGSPPLGFISDKVMKSRKKPFILCNLVLVIELAFLSIYPAGLPRIALYIFFFVFSICASAVVIFGFTLIKELFPVEIAGTSTGMVNLFPFLGGAIFMPLLGRVLDAYPKSDAGGYSLEAYTMLILILLGSSVLSLICTFLTKETYQDK
ncbi:MAG: MFS transporter, partial [Desulfobacteraceae bacterium]